MHKRFRIILAALVLVLSGIFALVPVKDASAASFNASSLDPGVPLNALRHAQCRANTHQVNFTFTTNSGNEINVYAPWDTTPSEDEIRQSCTQAINSVISQFGGAKISGDDGGYWDSAFGQWQEFDLEAADGGSGVTDFLSVNSGMDYLPGCIANQSECELQLQSNLSIRQSGKLQLGPNSNGISGFSQTGDTGGFGGGDTLSLVKFRIAPTATRLEICVVASPSTCFSTDISGMVSQYTPPTPDGGSGVGVIGEPQPRECDLGKFGWALCPILTGLDSMLGGAYAWVESNFLQIQLDFYRVDSGTYEAWAIFRNIANILFVVFFLVVIFSQVTSVGISNYGIKKMLPEIIMAAILINISFFVVQAMIDASNIVGFQIKSLLENIVSAGPAVGGVGLMENLTSILGATAIVAGVAVGGTLIAMTLMGGLSALLAAVLLFLLAAAIGVLILFLLLVVRQVGVIILVVLAPLAFAARILPNTQPLFRNWWKMITTLLLVYPICGLVIGGGKMAGRIIIMAVEGGTMGAEDVGLAFSGFFASIFGAEIGGQISHFAAVSGAAMYVVVAMIAMIAPYFAVITIIKGSLNGLGKLGGAISGKLNGVGKWGQSNLNKAPGLRNLQNIADRNRALRANAIKSKMDSANIAANAKKMANTEGGAIRKGIANTKLGKKLGISDKNIYGQIQAAEYAALQTKDDAAMANLGQYQDNGLRSKGLVPGSADWTAARQNEKLMRISAAARKRLGVNADGTPDGTKTFTAGSFEESQQQAARTAVLQQEAKQSKQIDESYDAMLSPGDVADTVFNSDTTGAMSGVAATDSSRLKLTGNDSADALRIERAIASLIKKGKIDKATELTKAYTASNLYAGQSTAGGAAAATATGAVNVSATKHNQQRLASILATGDVKREAANLYALGWQTNTALGQGSEKAFSYDAMNAGPVALMKSNGSGGWTAVVDSGGAAVNAKTIEAVVQSKIDTATVASQDKDADWSKFSASQIAGALTSNASVDKTNTMNKALTENETLSRDTAAKLDAKQTGKLDDTSFTTMRKNALLQVAAATKKAGRALTPLERDEAINGTSALLTAAERGAIANGTSTLLTSAEKTAVLDVANGRTGATSAYMASQAAAQAVTQKAFGEAYAQTQVAGSRAADDWSADRRKAFGL
jgi:hypothetical protein